MAAIDYGAMVFCDGKFINQNQLFQDMQEAVGWNDSDEKDMWLRVNDAFYAYIGNENITYCFSRHYLGVCINKEHKGIMLSGNYDGENYHKSHTYDFYGNKIHIKTIIPYKCYVASTRIDGRNYNVIYGLGIDPNVKTWNKVKVRYLGKKGAKQVDKLINKFWKDKTEV